MVFQTKKWDSAEFIRDDEDARFFLEAALEDSTAEDLVDALQTVARANGMRLLAEQAGLSRDALDLILNPFDGLDRTALLKLFEALGVQPENEHKKTDAA